jgi:hypothetical protein
VELAGRPREKVAPVLAALSAARLLRRIDPPERYEIFHDAFAVALLDWRKDYVQRRRLRTGIASAVGGVLVLGIVAGAGVYFVHERRDAEQTRLNLAAAQLRVRQSDSATAAAKAAQAAAEEAAKEAQLRLQAGQAQLEARLAGQNKAEAAQAAERARQATADADRAKAESARLTAESKAQLADADDSKRQIQQLAEVAQTQGITLFGVPATPVAPPPDHGTAANPTKNPPPDTSAAGGNPPPPVASGKYRDTFKKGVEAANENRWRDAQTLFAAALQQNPTESTERINISGFGNVQPYVPHYYLGLALKNLNDCAGALKEWGESEHEGAIQKTSLYKALQQNRSACGAK